MYWRTKKFQWQRITTTAFLGALATRPAAALLATPQVLLFVSGPGINPDAVIGDFVEPTFHGYAASVLTLVGPGNLSANDLGMLAPANFLATAGGAIADTVLGYLLVDTTSMIVYGWEYFDNPFSFALVGDFIDIDLVLPLPMSFTPTIV